MSFYNPVIVCGIVGWATAQIIKFFLNLFHNSTLQIERLYGSGGMPSSHSSLVCAAFVATARLVGIESPVTAVMFVLAAIVMYDAANVRLEAGKHAKQLNEIMERLLALDGDIDAKSKEFKELLGHTPLQVFCGAILGLLIGAVFPLG
ncbi:MAG: divergent PAP2 family protein [Oscillospiraceae bacterium]|nr:divergent PAP2 family protein [Oscillospiraceae bacterium]